MDAALSEDVDLARAKLAFTGSDGQEGLDWIVCVAAVTKNGGVS